LNYNAINFIYYSKIIINKENIVNMLNYINMTQEMEKAIIQISINIT